MLTRLADTWIAPEECAYPNGGMTRRCKVMHPDGKLRITWAGIPDTFYTIPAYSRVKGKYTAGYIYVDNGYDGISRFRFAHRGVIANVTGTVK